MIILYSDFRFGKCSPDKRLSPNKKFKHIRRHYYFVEKVEVAHLARILKIPRRTRRDVKPVVDNVNNKVGTSLCPWRWMTDDDPARSPRYFQKAGCSECRHYCRAVYFNHRALVRRCDETTGIRVWKWIDVLLPIAFLYDP
ncbi:hypothetical protein QZH41_006317 [Actinostola sp. cb2023]|nr:hypothetical protein QZH41_006317 [Actinostola sp. cb2023]